MNSKRIVYAVVLSFVLTIFPKVSFADHESPTIFVSGIIDEFLDILRFEKNKDLQKEKILNLMKTSFDFPGITEDLLSGLKVNDKDKSAFTDIFPLLLEMRYRMFIKSPDNLSVGYNGHELFFFDSEAVVHTRTKLSSDDIVLDYKLRHVDGKWKIYDLTADGISMVRNYRSQISKFLTRMSFTDFLIHLEKMVGKKTNSSDIQR